MNLILVDASELDGDGEVWLDGRRGRHVCQILRPAIGQDLAMGVVDGPVGRAEVLAFGGAERVRVRFAPIAASRASSPLHLVVALPRPKVAARIVEAGATFGVASIALINSWRVDKNYFASPLVTPEALRAAAWRGAEQGRTTHLPPIAVHARFMAFIDAQRSWVGQRWLCQPGGAATFLDRQVTQSPPRSHHMVVVGPEGGLIERELQTLAAHGFGTVALSNATLRTEHAVSAALAQLELSLGLIRPLA